MPLLKIKIDDEDVEFRIIPLNKKINNVIWSRFSYEDEGFIFQERGRYLAHVVKEPKMNIKEWESLPSSMIDKIIRNIKAYIDSIEYSEQKLRNLSMNLSVYEKEADDLYRYLQEDVEDWVWDRIKVIERNIDEIRDEMNKLEKSLDYVKSDYVLFEKDKEVDYDVQPLQLENSKRKEDS